MKQEIIRIQSAFDAYPLEVLIAQPEGEIKGIFQIAHGMAEHKERYLDFIEFLCGHGYVCCINDHRGHGKSVTDEKDLGWFKDKSGQGIVEDTHQISMMLKERFGNIPFILFGHSMGSLIVRAVIRKYDSDYSKMIVCGSPSANPAAGIAIGLIDTITLFKGEHHHSALITSMTTGAYNKNFKDNYNGWLSYNSENVRKYNDDKLCGFPFTLNGYRNLMILMRTAYAKNGWGMTNKKMPILFISGKEDPCAESEEKWRAAIDDMKSHGYSNVQGKMYENKRHEILLENDNQIVFNDILAFIS